MQHHRSPQAGSDVRRTAGQVSQSVGLREPDLVLDGLIQLPHPLPCLCGCEARGDPLQAQVILFVDHHGNGLVRSEGHPPSGLGRSVGIARGQVAADQVPLAQQQTQDRRGRLHVHPDRLAPDRLALQHGLQALRQLLRLPFLKTVDEGIALDVAGQARAARHDDVRLRPVGDEPAAHVVREALGVDGSEGHGGGVVRNSIGILVVFRARSMSRVRQLSPRRSAPGTTSPTADGTSRPPPRLPCGRGPAMLPRDGAREVDAGDGPEGRHRRVLHG